MWASGDAAAVAKALNTFAKASDNRLSMKGGLLEGAPISADELKQLASLPSRDELLARLVGGVASPLQGTANALNSLISGMARALGAYHAQRVAEAPAEAEAPAAPEAPAADEAPAEEAPAAEASTEENTDAAPEASADDTAEAAQEPAADDTTDAEPAADDTTEGD